jgi:hypothetical protein
MLKTAYQLGFEQALEDAGLSLEEFEKMAGLGTWAKNLFNLGKKAPLKPGFTAKQFRGSPESMKMLSRSGVDTNAFQAVRGAAARSAGKTKPVNIAPQIPTTMEQSLAQTHRRMFPAGA